MDNLVLEEDKILEWQAVGGPMTAINHLGDAVAKNANFAEQNGILYKSVDAPVIPEDDVSDISPPVTEVVKEPVEEPVDSSDDMEGTEDGGDEPTGSVEPVAADGSFAKSMEAFLSKMEKSVTSAISEALMTYHKEVVVPLEAELAELRTIKSDSTSDVSLFGDMFDALSFLPASRMTDVIKSTFVKQSDSTSTKDVILKAEDVVAAEKNIEQQTKDVGQTSHDSVHMLAGI